MGLTRWRTGSASTSCRRPPWGSGRPRRASNVRRVCAFFFLLGCNWGAVAESHPLQHTTLISTGDLEGKKDEKVAAASHTGADQPPHKRIKSVDADAGGAAASAAAAAEEGVGTAEGHNNGNLEPSV